MRHFRKIRFQLALIMLVCYLVPTVALGFYMGGAVLRDMRARSEAALETGLEYSMSLTDQSLQKLVELARDATYDGELTEAFARREAGEIYDDEFLRLARNYIERKYGREPLLTCAVCFTLDAPDLLLVNRAGAEAAAEYSERAHGAVRGLSEELDTQCRFVMLGGRVYLVRNLMNLRMKPYGMLVLGVNVDRAAAPLTKLARTWSARLDLALDDVSLADVTASGAALDPGLPEGDLEPGQIVPAGVGQYAALGRGTSRDYDLGALLVIPRARLYGEIDAFRGLLAALLGLLLPVLGVICWYIYRRITKPIALLSEASRRIEAGELGVTVPMRGDDELGSLGKAFSNMSLRLKALIDQTYKEEIALRDARIQAMQSRINPHFINNALESINWQARMEGSETISSMVESLSVLLNAGMSRNDRRVLPLREELETARAYFYFVGLRFGERLETEIDADPACLADTLPALSVQPLIENAVEHGIAPAGEGAIRLTCARAGDALRVTVSNSGRPAAPEDVERMRRALAGDSHGGAHLGLSNIAERLRLIYGGQASIALDVDAPGWTRVVMEIPQNAKEDTTP